MAIRKKTVKKKKERWVFHQSITIYPEKQKQGGEGERQCEPRPWRRMRRFSSVPSSLGE
jgi:hypothetical protein